MVEELVIALEFLSAIVMAVSTVMPKVTTLVHLLLGRPQFRLYLMAEKLLSVML
jgi:hypothetical protein